MLFNLRLCVCVCGGMQEHVHMNTWHFLFVCLNIQSKAQINVMKNCYLKQLSFISRGESGESLVRCVVFSHPQRPAAFDWEMHISVSLLSICQAERVLLEDRSLHKNDIIFSWYTILLSYSWLKHARCFRVRVHDSNNSDSYLGIQM